MIGARCRSAAWAVAACVMLLGWSSGEASAQAGRGRGRRDRDAASAEAAATAEAPAEAASPPPTPASDAPAVPAEDPAPLAAAAPAEPAPVSAPHGSPPAAEVAPTSGSDAAPAHYVRLSAYGGLGTVAEDESASRSTLSLVGGELSVLAVPGLDLGIGTEASFYERRYLLTLPDAQGGAGGDVTLAETRVRSTLHVGYDVIDGTGVGGGVGGLVIALRGTVDTFLNGVVPQTAVNLGGEVRGWGRVADELVLDAGGSWLAAVYAGDTEVLSRLALGGVVSDLRWGAGASLVLEPRARVRLSYAGEWLALVHAARVAHSVNLEVSIDL